MQVMTGDIRLHVLVEFYIRQTPGFMPYHDVDALCCLLLLLVCFGGRAAFVYVVSQVLRCLLNVNVMM